MLKPLLAWVAAAAEPFVADRQSWESLARRAVIHSDNEAATALWTRVGEQQVLASIRARTDVDWQTDRSGSHGWRRVLVTADELATAYAAFAGDHGRAAVQLRAWMRAVPDDQTFGARRVASEMLHVPRESVGVKCGWWAVVRVHAVTLVELRNRTLGAAVTTFRPQDLAGRAAYAVASSRSEVLAVHDALTGPFVRSGTRRALQLAATL